MMIYFLTLSPQGLLHKTEKVVFVLTCGLIGGLWVTQKAHACVVVCQFYQWNCTIISNLAEVVQPSGKRASDKYKHQLHNGPSTTDKLDFSDTENEIK